MSLGADTKIGTLLDGSVVGSTRKLTMARGFGLRKYTGVVLLGDLPPHHMLLPR